MTVAVVLGMHKSGTSVISEILHHSGIEMVEEGARAAYDDGYHHERELTRRINKALLCSEGQHSLKTTNRVPFEEADPDTAKAAADFVTRMTERGIDWGFKDPRTCLTYDVWRQVLPDHKLVCIFRDVNEVQQHYARARKGSVVEVLRAWHCYNSEMLRAYRSARPDRRILIHYGSFMRDDRSLSELSRFLDRPLEDRRSATLQRSGASTGSFAIQAQLYRIITGRDVHSLNKQLHLFATGSTDAISEVPTGRDLDGLPALNRLLTRPFGI